MHFGGDENAKSTAVRSLEERFTHVRFWRVNKLKTSAVAVI